MFRERKKQKKTVFIPLKWVKRKCLTSTPKHGETSRPSYLQKHGFKDKVVQNLKISRYDRVFKLLLRHVQQKCPRGFDTCNEERNKEGCQKSKDSIFSNACRFLLF